MKQTILAFAGASSLLLGGGGASTLDFNDGNRALQRVDDMKDLTPLTEEERNRLTFMVQDGHLHMFRKEDLLQTSPEEGENSPRARILGRQGPPSTSRSQARAKKTTKHSEHYEDDYYVYYEDDYAHHEDDWSFNPGGGLEYVSMYLEGFQDGQTLTEAFPPNVERPDEFDAGTTYVFDKESVLGVVTDSFFTGTNFTVNESDEFATVSGKCIRTDPSDELDAEYMGRAYCHFVYSFGSFDEIVAEGVITVSDEAVLTVTGGLGVFRRAAGEVVLTVADTAAFPEVFLTSGDLPSSYYMQAYLYMDQSMETFF